MYFASGCEYEKAMPACSELQKIPGVNVSLINDSYHKHIWLLEAFSAEASKQNAIQSFREAYGYTNVVGFGDNLNDLPMFSACDVSVAVENAKDEVKAAADFICGPFDTDGVVRWIESRIQPF